MKNIFENAKFGDKFLTRDGKIAILIHAPSHEKDYYRVLIEKNTLKEFASDVPIKEDGSIANHRASIRYEKGKYNDDIVSRYQEPIDEERLDEIATEYGIEYINSNSKMHIEFESKDILLKTPCSEGFKAGYRKAKEE